MVGGVPRAAALGMAVARVRGRGRRAAGGEGGGGGGWKRERRNRAFRLFLYYLPWLQAPLVLIVSGRLGP